VAERLTFEIDAAADPKGPPRRSSALAYHAAGDARGEATLVLAHGAGAPQQSAFMAGFAKGLAERGVDVLTFNFLYMEQRRRVPDRTGALEACYRAAIGVARQHFRRDTVFIGGKSMGGRIATHLAAADDAGSLGIAGVVLLGYPLHPPGKPDQLRAAHLPRIRVPMLFVQGERDPFGTPDELRRVLEPLSSQFTLHVVEKGDHSLAPSRQATAVASTYSELQDVIARWIGSHHEAVGPT
jgi:predicted alpha/beta-hydrolase family hydrolase